MRVLFVINPSSGKGRAVPVLGTLERAIAGIGHAPQVHDLQRDTDETLRARLDEAEIAVVIGGDGTMRACAQHARTAGVAFYHAAVGTENLFAREFKMDARPQTLLRAITSGTRHRVDVGCCNERRFLIMVSVGLDASVIRRLDARRTGAISHLSYARPILDELCQPFVPSITVEAEGETIVDGRAGTLVIANSRQYAMRVDPVPSADMSDGMLDMVFMPHTGVFGFAAWNLRARLRRHLRTGRAVQHRARAFTVRAEGETVHQFDGEAGVADQREIAVRLAPEQLTVLAP